MGNVERGGANDGHEGTGGGKKKEGREKKKGDHLK